MLITKDIIFSRNGSYNMALGSYQVVLNKKYKHLEFFYAYELCDQAANLHSFILELGKNIIIIIIFNILIQWKDYLYVQTAWK